MKTLYARSLIFLLFFFVSSYGFAVPCDAYLTPEHSRKIKPNKRDAAVSFGVSVLGHALLFGAVYLYMNPSADLNLELSGASGESDARPALVIEGYLANDLPATEPAPPATSPESANVPEEKKPVEEKTEMKVAVEPTVAEPPVEESPVTKPEVTVQPIRTVEKSAPDVKPPPPPKPKAPTSPTTPTKVAQTQAVAAPAVAQTAPAPAATTAPSQQPVNLPSSVEESVLNLKASLDKFVQYPPLAKQHEISGNVVVGFQIHKDGRIRNISLIESSGYQILDDEAMRAVRSLGRIWRYQDAGRDLVAAPYDVIFPVEFKLVRN